MKIGLQGRLYAICDNTPNPDRKHVALAQHLLRGGAQVLQLRIKGNTPFAKKRRRRVAHKIMQLKRSFSFCFIINDDPYLVREIGADGVHVGSDDLSIDACRRMLGPRTLIGYSSHSIREACEAQTRGADYVALGAIFPSPLKGPGHPVQGVETLSRLLAQISIPVVAIGGITRQNASIVCRTGVSMVAAISALTGANDVTVATREMLNVLSA
jgi:thiamine-phosphate diphosphorylase